jgi:hypothetical protein
MIDVFWRGCHWGLQLACHPGGATRLFCRCAD